jgi:hypothetical protein
LERKQRPKFNYREYQLVYQKYDLHRTRGGGILACEEQKSGLTVRAATVEEILPFVTSAARFGGAAGLAERLATSGQAFILEQDGAAIFGYTLEANGGAVFITSASGRSQCDLTETGLAVIEAQAAGFDTMGFKTTRRGLVKKAQRLGYEIESYTMRKKLKC